MPKINIVLNGSATPGVHQVDCQPLLTSLKLGLKRSTSTNLIPLNQWNQPLNGTEKQMVFFLKPEIFFDGVNQDQVLQTTVEALARQNYGIQGLSVLTSEFIAQNKIIERHYGVINRIFNQGVSALSPAARDSFQTLFGVGIENAPVFAGAAVPQRFGLSSQQMNQDWMQGLAAGQVKKLAPGTYVFPTEIRGEPVYILNGFHQTQVEHFTSPGRKVVAFCIMNDSSTATNWAEMRESFVGQTSPSKAKIGSLRRQFLDQMGLFGLTQVDSFFNGVHLSAGPLEAIAEVQNWFSYPDSIIQIQDTVMGRIFLKAGISLSNIEWLLSNPVVEYQSKSLPVFDHTEGLEPQQALAVVKEILPSN